MCLGCSPSAAAGSWCRGSLTTCGDEQVSSEEVADSRGGGEGAELLRPLPGAVRKREKARVKRPREDRAYMAPETEFHL